ncbi:MAG TPA: hypothetical protein VJH67_03635 [Candidatus Paceibacterota bacterium]
MLISEAADKIVVCPRCGWKGHLSEVASVPLSELLPEYRATEHRCPVSTCRKLLGCSNATETLFADGVQVQEASAV